MPPLARLVDEVQVDAGQRHGELPEAVQRGLVLAPIEPGLRNDEAYFQ